MPTASDPVGFRFVSTVMYPGFSSAAAAAVGDRRAAALFSEIAHDEGDHAAAFLGAFSPLS